MQHSQTTPGGSKFPAAAVILCILLSLTVCGSILGIGYVTQNVSLPSDTEASGDRIFYADIYQNGTLLQSISLSQVTEEYSFVITGEQGCTNKITVSPCRIGITEASCPDRLCVHRGFISTSILPITCLPNRLVIQIRMEETSDIDMMTY